MPSGSDKIFSNPIVFMNLRVLLFGNIKFFFGSSLLYVRLASLSFLLSTFYASSQSYNFASPSDAILGRNGATSTNPWSVFSNPGGIATTQNPVAAIGYENSYLINELSSRAALIIYPSSLIVVAATMSHQGFEYFSNQQYSLVLARKMAPWLNMGLRYNQLVRHQTGNEKHYLSIFDAGLQFSPSPQVVVGFFAVNPALTQWSLAHDSEYVQSLIASSVAYSPTTNLILEVGVCKELEHKAILSFGIEAPLHNTVVLRGGVSSYPLRLAFGTGIEWQRFNFDLGVNHHPQLGFSSAAGIVFNIGSLSVDRKQSHL
jgi:hypothetical protein